MADLLSPGVKVTREDMSQVIPVEGDSAAVFGGDFEKGPVGVHALISSVQELRDNYGYPTTKNYNQYYQAQNFLAYSGAIYVSRAADINGTPTILDGVTFEENAYKTNVKATKIEDVNLISVDSVDIKFDKTDKFEVGQVLKFGTSNKEYKVKYIRNVTEQIPNPEYKPLTQLVVDPAQASMKVDEVIDYVITTDAEDYTVEAENPSIALVNKSLKTITALKEGTTFINFKATREGCREIIVEFKVEVTAKEQTRLIVSPEQLNIVKGQKGTILVDTDASDYTITSKNRAIATIEPDKKTINGLRIGSCYVELRAQAEGKTEVVKQITVTVNEGKETTLKVTPEGPLDINVNDKQTFTVETNGTSVMGYSQEADKEFISINDAEKSCTGLKEGTAVIKFRAIAEGAGEVERRVTVNVHAVELPDMDGVLFNKESIDAKINQGEQVITATLPEHATLDATIENNTFATLVVENNLLKVTPKAAGSTNINVVVTKEGFNDFTKVIPVNITDLPDLEDVTIDRENINITNEQTEDININLSYPAGAEVSARSDNRLVANIILNDKILVVKPIFVGKANIIIDITKDGFKPYQKVIPVVISSANAPIVEFSVDEIRTRVNKPVDVKLNPKDVYEMDLITTEVISSDGLTADITNDGLTYHINPLTAGTGIIKFTCKEELYPDLIKELPTNVAAEDANPNVELRVEGSKPENINTTVGTTTTIKYSGEIGDSRNCVIESSDGLQGEITINENETTFKPTSVGTGKLKFTFTVAEKTTNIDLPVTVTNPQLRSRRSK